MKDEEIPDPIQSESVYKKEEPAPAAPAARVTIRVSDPYGVAYLDEHGNFQQHERGDVVTVSGEVAKKLFREGKVALEEMRPAGAPPFVEKR